MYCIYRLSNPFQILSLEFIPEIFLKFRKKKRTVLQRFCTRLIHIKY